MLTRSQEIEVVVERPAVGGAMIARASGAIVLVVGAIPGERVRVRVDRVTKGVAHASTIEVLSPSSDRRPTDADIRCGGNLYAHIAYPRQLALKAAVVADAFVRIARMPLTEAVPVAPSRDEGYRMRARLHARGGSVGFYLEGTHTICASRGTRQLRPDTCDVLERTVDAARGLWGDRDAELAVSENVAATERAIHLFVPDPRAVRLDEIAGAVTGALADAPAPVTGLSVSGLPGTSVDEHLGRVGRVNRVDRVDRLDASTTFADDAHALLGSPYVTDEIVVSSHALSLRRHVLGFFQGNRFLLGPLTQHVVDQVEPDGALVDLYAGCGLFSVAAAVVRGVRVTAVEGGRESAADLAHNAKQSGAAIDVRHEPVERFVRRPPPPARTVIVDPPRTGLSPDALQGLRGLGPSRIVYVSCDVATLARDARTFVDGGYRVGRIDAFDLFPNTPHVETIVVFDR